MSLSVGQDLQFENVLEMYDLALNCILYFKASLWIWHSLCMLGENFLTIYKKQVFHLFSFSITPLVQCKFCREAICAPAQYNFVQTLKPCGWLAEEPMRYSCVQCII